MLGLQRERGAPAARREKYIYVCMGKRIALLFYVMFYFCSFFFFFAFCYLKKSIGRGDTGKSVVRIAWGKKNKKKKKGSWGLGAVQFPRAGRGSCAAFAPGAAHP